MFTESAEFYDAIYARVKDYKADAALIADIIRGENRDARTVLDVACGTGEHVRHLSRDHGFEVDGLDVDPALLRIARQKNPPRRFFEADMSDFALVTRYDVVMCLFSSIAYVVTLERVTSALTCFRQHLAPNGVVIVEPWFPPGILDTKRVTRHEGEIGDTRVERTSSVEVDGRISRLHFEYRIERPDGVQVASEIHELGLFTTDEMTAAFREAGLVSRYDPEGLMGRGLFVARIDRG